MLFRKSRFKRSGLRVLKRLHVGIQGFWVSVDLKRK